MAESSHRSQADIGRAALRDNGGQVYSVKARPFGAKGDGAPTAPSLTIVPPPGEGDA